MRSLHSQSSHNTFNDMLDKHPLPRVLRNRAWIERFLQNCKLHQGRRTVGLIDFEEVETRKLVNEESTLVSSESEPRDVRNFKPKPTKYLRLHGRLPKTRTNSCILFQVAGVDSAPSRAQKGKHHVLSVVWKHLNQSN